MAKSSDKPEDGISLQSNPEVSASWLSRIFFWFLNPLIQKGNGKRLDPRDMFEPLPDMESQSATEKLSILWESEQNAAQTEGRSISLFRTIFYFNKKLLFLGLYILVEEICIMLQPLFMGRLIRHFRFENSLNQENALLSAGYVSLFAIGIVAFHNPYSYTMQKVGLRTRVAASGLIAQKSVRLSSAGLSKVSIGHVINLITTDVAKFDTAFVYINYLWISPLLFCFNVYVIWNEIGAASLAGFVGLLMLSPVQAYFSKKIGDVRQKIAEKTDERISFINEVLNGIRLIKMFSWEDAFLKRVGELRKNEMTMFRRSALYQSVVRGIFWPCGKFLLLLTATSYVYTGNDLSAEKIFVASALLNAFRLPVMLYLPFAVEAFYELRVVCSRIQDFLLLEQQDKERLDQIGKQPIENISDRINLENANDKRGTKLAKKRNAKDDAQTVVLLENLTTTWNTEKNGAVAITNVTLNAHRGQLIGIVGPVGCGKSSLLASILRETRRIDGNLTIKGTIAYCSQEAWIFRGTIRDNILFGREMDRDLYSKSLEYSSLLADLDQIPSGDKAIVGDRGTSLSGGQRARVALARAIYSDADIYLLDDPLSAVDAKVGREIFENCISKFLRNRTVILVTHQLQFLGQVDQIFLMTGGEVVASGSPKELKESNAELFSHALQEITESYDNLRPPSLQEESASEGPVLWKIYWKYLTSMCSHKMVLLLTVAIVFAVQILLNLVDYCLTKWTSAAETASRLRDNHTITSTTEYVEHLPLFLNIAFQFTLLDWQNLFTILTVLLIIVSVIRCVWIRIAQTIASEVQHEEMFESVLRTGMEFFDANPIGRILSRFSKDVNTVDVHLSFVVFELTINALSTIGVIMMIVFINPYVLVTITPLVLIVTYLRQFYLSTAQDVRRLEATSRSPLYTHISTTLHGLTTLRAYDKTAHAMKTFHEKTNINTSAMVARMGVNRWFSVHIDWMAAIFVAIVAFVAVWSPKVFSSGEVALMLLYAAELSSTFTWVLRMTQELHNHMVCMERIVDYSELPSEFESDSKKEIPPADWPSKATIEFEHLCMKYDSLGELVLNNVSFSTKNKEKIGIVGRTGAGKSSLLRAIFRLTPPFSGRILIDGVDISTIPLKTLRKSLSIIPQEPVLFVGTVRDNIDPLNEHSNEEIWDALDAVELRETMSMFGLDAPMQEGGSNFSVGQRQLVCLARAILRKAKIVVIDEATANVDQQTDRQIQSTIRRRFKESTVLTIAHRLSTIMDSDRILVLNNGRVEEFDTPTILLQRKDSLLNKLMGSN